MEAAACASTLPGGEGAVRSVKTLSVCLLFAVLAGLGLGCSGDKDKGINSNREKPKAAQRSDAAEKPRS